MKILSAVLILIMLLTSHGAVESQECPINIDEALTEAAGCASIGANEVCFGHTPVESLVNCELAPNFAAPGDVLPLESMCTLRTGAMQSTGEWGLAVMRVLPHAAAQPITIVLVGEAELYDAASGLQALDAHIDTDVSVLSGPASTFAEIGRLTAGQVVHVNACNCTGNWLRTVLEDGRVGWIASSYVTTLGEASSLPVVSVDTPVYESMQAFTLRSGSAERACAEVPEDGILIQVPSGADPVPIQINGVPILLGGTAFVQSQLGTPQTIEVLAGFANVTGVDFVASVTAGMRAVILMSDSDTVSGAVQVEPFSPTDVEALPITLLPEPVDVMAVFEQNTPQIVGHELCRVVSNVGGTVCPLYFADRDGDAISRMDVEFVSAPMGDWTGSILENPVIIAGDTMSGALAWNVTCSLGTANFIGPIIWSITLTDAAGNVSQPFEASFYCIDGP
mgnify:CR=1 FL=1